MKTIIKIIILIGIFILILSTIIVAVNFIYASTIKKKKCEKMLVLDFPEYSEDEITCLNNSLLSELDCSCYISKKTGTIKGWEKEHTKMPDTPAYKGIDIKKFNLK